MIQISGTERNIHSSMMFNPLIHSPQAGPVPAVEGHDAGPVVGLRRGEAEFGLASAEFE